MSEHIVKAFGEELAHLAAEVARMGGLTEAQVADAVDTVTRDMLPGDRPGYDPSLPQPAYVVDSFLEPTPPLRRGEAEGDRRWRYRLDADGDLVRVADDPWDPASDPVYGPALRAVGEE